MSENQSLKEKTAKGLFWGGFSNGIQQLLNLLFGIFLARLLTPSDYGMVGMLAIFSLIASSIQESGFTAALVNKKEVTHNDYNAVFWFNAAISLSLYLLLFLCAPLIADFYYTPELTPLARYSFIGFFIASLGNIPQCLSSAKPDGETAGPVFRYRAYRIRNHRSHSCLLWFLLLGNCYAKHRLRNHQHSLLLAFHPLATELAIQFHPD